MRTVRSPLLILLLLGLALSNPVLAQTKKSKGHSGQLMPHSRWAEPRTFFGLELAKPLMSQTTVIVQCPSSPVSPGSTFMLRDLRFTGFCYEDLPVGDGKFRIAHNGPDIGIRYAMTLILIKEALHGALVTIGRSETERFLALLTEKYGEPHEKRMESYQNRMGASFQGAVYEWSGPTVALFFSEYGSSLNESVFQIITHAARASKSSDDAANAQKHKSKL